MTTWHWHEIEPSLIEAAQRYDLAHRYDMPGARSSGWRRVRDEQVARLLAGAFGELARAGNVSGQ